MDFKELSDFFGGTIFPEEGRGDLKKLGADLAVMQQALQTSPDLIQEPGIILTRAVWHMHSGEFKAARRELELLDHEKYGRRWIFRAKLYKLLHWLWTTFPPLFKYDSRTTTDKMMMVLNVRPRKKILGFTENREYIMKNHASPLTNIDDLEFGVIYALVNLNTVQINILRPGNPDSLYFGTADEVELANEVRSGLRENLKAIQSLARYHDLECVYAYLERVLFEIAKATGNFRDMLKHLGGLRLCYSAIVDWHGLGIYEMLRGDTIVSPDLTSPLMMNFKADIHVTDDEFGGFASQRWGLCTNVASDECVMLQSDPPEYVMMCEHLSGNYPLDVTKEVHDFLCSLSTLEDKVAASGLWTAIPHYRRAIMFFQMANELNGGGSSRGIAKALLTLACVVRLHVWQPRILSKPSDKISMAHKQVDSWLGTARTLLEKTGDGDLLDLVTVHELLSEFSSIEQKSLVRAIGRRLQTCGNPSLASFYGLLPYRMGIHFRYVCGDLLKARSCFEFSRQLFARISTERPTWSRAQIASADCQLHVGAYAIAKALFSALRGQFPILSNALNPKTETGQQTTSTLPNRLKNFGDLYTAAHGENLDIVGALNDLSVTDPDLFASLNAPITRSQLENDAMTLVKDAAINNEKSRWDPLGSMGISRHTLMREIEGVLKTDAIIGDPHQFPDQQTIDVIEALSSKGTPTAWSFPNWHAARDNEVMFQRTVMKWNLYTRSGDLENSTKILQQYINGAAKTTSLTLMSKIYLIDIFVKAGYLMEARTMASQLQTTEVLLDENDSPQSMLDKALVRERRIMKSKEVIYHCQVNAGAWIQAKTSMEILEGLSPGYFTSLSSYSPYLPWQRCVSAGLVYEGIGERYIAWKYFFQAWTFIGDLSANTGRANHRRALAENADIGRLTNSLVRILLLRTRNDFSGEVLKSGVHKGIDTTIFDQFAGEDSLGEFLWRSSEPQYAAFILLEISNSQYVSDMIIASSTEQFDLEWRQLLYDQDLHDEYASRANKLTEEEQVEFQRLEKLQGVDGIMEQQFRQFSISREAAELQLSSQDPVDNSSLQKQFDAIPTNAMVIYTSSSVDGYCMFALDARGILYHQWNSETNSSDIREKVLVYLSSVEGSRGENNPLDCLPSLTELSDIILRPLHDMIEEKEHIIFVPSGDLTRLPLGALLHNGQPLILQKAVSQTPSLRYLHLSENVDPHQSHPRLSVIAKAGPPRPNDTEDPLAFAGIEALMISHLYSSSEPLSANTITRDEFKHEMETSTILHISTHGNVNTSSPLMSSISLAEKYRVIDLSLLRTRNVDLAIFSACLTGQGRANPSGDILGFSHATLASGAQVYVGALWTANDIVTMIHMYHFHHCLLNNIDVSVAENWAQATRKLYHMSHEDAANLLESFVETWDEIEKSGKEPKAFVPKGRNLLKAVIRRLGTKKGRRELNFKHPYFWAPFTVIGNGGLVVTTPC